MAEKTAKDYLKGKAAAKNGSGTKRNDGNVDPKAPVQSHLPDKLPKTLIGANSTAVQAILGQWDTMIQRALPAKLNVNSTQMITWMTSVLMANPELRECTLQSIVGCALVTSVFGLNPEQRLGNIYYIARRNKKTGQKEMTWLLGPRGKMSLVSRNPNVESLFAYEVYEKDDFQVVLGSENPRILHKPSMEADRGPLRFVYAVAKMKNGQKVFRYLNRKQVMARKAKSEAKGSNYSPWNGPFEYQMWIKSAIDELSKWFDYDATMEAHEGKAVHADDFDVTKGAFNEQKIEEHNNDIQDADYDEVVDEDDSVPENAAPKSGQPVDTGDGDDDPPKTDDPPPDEPPEPDTPPIDSNGPGSKKPEPESTKQDDEPPSAAKEKPPKSEPPDETDEEKAQFIAIVTKSYNYAKAEGIIHYVPHSVEMLDKYLGELGYTDWAEIPKADYGKAKNGLKSIRDQIYQEARNAQEAQLMDDNE